MKGKQKFFLCKQCGNLIALIDDKGAPMSCCGSEMAELAPNTVDASNEKHVPEVTVLGNTISVQVGSVLHPMVDEHYIQFIYVATENGGQRKCLKPGDKPTAEFRFIDDKPVAVYEYCNMRGLRRKELN